MMGQSRVETTMVYLRRLDRRRSMETVRGLDWGVRAEQAVTAMAGLMELQRGDVHIEEGTDVEA